MTGCEPGFSNETYFTWQLNLIILPKTYIYDNIFVESLFPFPLSNRKVFANYVFFFWKLIEVMHNIDVKINIKDLVEFGTCNLS